MKLTKYEITRMLGARALQLSSGAPFVVKLSKQDLEDLKYNTLSIAMRELEKGVLPITIKRPKPKVVLKEE